MKDLTALVVTMMRDEYLFKCISSLREVYPDINIVVGDNGYPSKEKKIFCEEHGAKYFELPFDCGICVGRNMLVDRIKTIYTMVGDDDFFYTPGAKVNKMLEFMRERPEFDLIGGRIEEGGSVRNYQGFIDFYPGHFIYRSLELDKFKTADCGLQYKACELTFNFFVAKTEMLKAVRWDEQIKVAYEHSTFFIDAKKAGKKVAFTPDAIVVHKPPITKAITKEYHDYRNRKSDKERFFSKYNLAYVVDMRGRRDSFGREFLKQVDFLITTFKRRECLERLLFSIAKYYPEANIYVGDQGKIFDAAYYKNLWQRLFEAGLFQKPVAYNLPFDSGLSYGRNFLVKQSPNIFKLILEDDFIFTEKTQIDKMIKLIEISPEIGAVGGLVRQDGIDIHFEHRLVREGQILRHKGDGDDWQEVTGIRFKETGCVMNFTLFRKEVLADVKWDEAIKIQGEHTDFYLRLKETPWRVLYTEDVLVEHEHVQDSEYREFRRRDDFLKLFFKKHKLTWMIYLNGYALEYNPEKDLIIRHQRNAVEIK